MAAPVVPIHEASTVGQVILNWNAHHRDLSLRQHDLSPASSQPVLSDTTAETQNTKQLSTQTITINFTSFFISYLLAVLTQIYSGELFEIIEQHKHFIL